MGEAGQEKILLCKGGHYMKNKNNGGGGRGLTTQPDQQKRLFCFGSLVILDVARCYLWLCTLYINIKKVKIVVKC